MCSPIQSQWKTGYPVSAGQHPHPKTRHNAVSVPLRGLRNTEAGSCLWKIKTYLLFTQVFQCQPTNQPLRKPTAIISALTLKDRRTFPQDAVLGARVWVTHPWRYGHILLVHRHVHALWCHAAWVRVPFVDNPSIDIRWDSLSISAQWCPIRGTFG